jgi:hypothetical protein
MQHFQSDDEDKRENILYESVNLLSDVVTEPESIGEVIGLMGEGVQYSAETMIETGGSLLGVLGELLGGLLS